jgi:hypothetical protein
MNVFQVTTRTPQQGAEQRADLLGRSFWRADYRTASQALQAAQSAKGATVWYHRDGITGTGQVIPMPVLEKFAAQEAA